MRRALLLAGAVSAALAIDGVEAADPPRGAGSVVEATMTALSAESATMTAPTDEVGRELVEARRTWRAVSIELLRAASSQPWSSQSAFVTGMRMSDARSLVDAAFARALAKPRSDADVARLAGASRAFTERGAATIQGIAADDPARIDAVVTACLGDLPDALMPFDVDGPGSVQPDADLWPDSGSASGSTPSLERLVIALKQFPASDPWVARATAGTASLRQAAARAAFRPPIESMSGHALGALHLLRTIGTVTWLDGEAIIALRQACEAALASLDRPGERDACAAELGRLDRIGALLDDLAVLCAGRGGRPPLGVDGAARCVGLVMQGDRTAERTRAALALARSMRVQADDLSGTMPTLMGSMLRASSRDRTALAVWLSDGAGVDPPAGCMAATERTARDLELLHRASTTIARAASLGTRAQQSARRSAERAGDGLKLDRTRDAARDQLTALVQRLDAWLEFPGEAQLRSSQSTIAACAGPMASRLAARIDRTRSQWSASLGRPEHSAVREMELLERVMQQVDRLARLGIGDHDVLATSAALSRWAAWAPSAEGVAVTLAPLQPRIMLICTAAAEGQWDECGRLLESVERELPLAEFVAVVNGRIGGALPRTEPRISALIRSMGAPLHEGSWLAADRSRLATLARAWRELRHATSTGADDQAQSCAAVTTQVARDLLDSLAATGPDSVAP